MSPKRAEAIFRSKPVYLLHCNECDRPVCMRGMKAILLADVRIALYSTDNPPLSYVEPAGDSYSTEKCHCQIQDTFCRHCGNTVGYHVVRPCNDCLGACNNGHLWMFHSSATSAHIRLNSSGSDYLLWQDLTHQISEETEISSCDR